MSELGKLYQSYVIFYTKNIMFFFYVTRNKHLQERKHKFQTFQARYQITNKGLSTKGYSLIENTKKNEKRNQKFVEFVILFSNFNKNPEAA